MLIKIGLTLLALIVFNHRAAGESVSKRQVNAGWPYDTVPHIADGGSWKTTLIVSNLDSGKIQKFKLVFHGDDGTPKRFSVQGHGSVDTLSGELPLRGSAFFETTGAGSLQTGWVELDLLGTDSNVGLTVIFGTSGIAGRPDYEATVPGGFSLQYEGVLPFDNTRGFVTSIALLNPSPYSTSSVPVTITDEAGRTIRTESITLEKGRKIAFSTADRWPETIGQRGSILFHGTLSSWSVLGIRFNPSGSFTTLNLLEP